MISQETDRLARLVEAAVDARRRLIAITGMSEKFGLRLSELRSLELACQAADEAIVAFHCQGSIRSSLDHEAAECEIDGIDSLQFTGIGEFAPLGR